MTARKASRKRRLPRVRAAFARLERRQAVIRLIREEPDVAQANYIPAAPVEIRVRISPPRLDAFDVGTGESIALGVETQQAFGDIFVRRS